MSTTWGVTRAGSLARDAGRGPALAVRSRAGTGVPVVLLHGVFLDHRLWAATLEVAALGNPLVTIDGIGHGGSAPMADRETLDDHVARLADVLGTLGLGPVVLVGHSWGGMQSLRLATRRPDLVGGVLLVNTPLERSRGTARAGFRAQRGLLAAGLPARTYGTIAARSLYSEQALGEDPGLAAQMAGTTARMGRRGVRAVLRSVLLEPDDTVALLGALPASTALHAVTGADDYVATPRVVDALRLAGATHTVAPGGHISPHEAPEDVAAAVGAIVDDVRSRASRPPGSTPA